LREQPRLGIIEPMVPDEPTAAAASVGSARCAGPAALERALNDGRAALLQLCDTYRAALGDELRVPCSPELNLPLWELGHIGWFETHWLAGNPQRAAGNRADPCTVAAAPDDALYDSSRVAHASRWSLPLPSVRETLAELTRGRRRTLELLADVAAQAGDDELYFFRLALLHEAMHREAWVYMAQTLDIRLPPAAVPRHNRTEITSGTGELSLPGGRWLTGWQGRGFAFDNELAPHEVHLPSYAIDRAPVSWRRYLPFVEAGGYEDARLWSREGWAWRCRAEAGRGAALPRYLQREGNAWSCRRFGRRIDLDLDQPAIHLSLYEAQAWCRWTGRRLPSEGEWEMAACAAAANSAAGDGFHWGEVWEWTASPFLPYPGFVAHPYRDYSQPWFGSHQVLRGASFATAPSIRHPRYRNFYLPGRNDIFAGFRSCPA
jgi:gamma-glutamyl hercynylcysteine S-oxide synthase